jgi:hypothetical protein
MQRVVMGILATMLVASLVLAVAAFALPTPAAAAPVEPMGCPRYWCYWPIFYGCHTCGACLEEVKQTCCQDDYCAGMETICWPKEWCQWCCEQPPWG